MKYLLAMMLITLMPVVMVAQDYQEIKPSDLPKGVSTYVTQHMPEGKIARAAKGLKDGKTVYAVVIEIGGNKRIMVFDENGNFLKRVESMSQINDDQDPRTKGPDPNNTTNTTPNPAVAPTTYLKENQIPPAILSYLKANLTDYSILQAKQIMMGNSPMYQLIVRDKINDYVCTFDGKGDNAKRRTYPHKSSPFKHQFPLPESTPAATPAAASEEKRP